MTDTLRFEFPADGASHALHAAPLAWFKPAGKFLDLGCGPGESLGILKEAGVESIGVDQDPLAVEEALRRGLNVVESDMFRFLGEIDDDSLDGILLSHVVEHLNSGDFIRLIEASRTRLKIGGRILIVTPNSRSLHAHLEAFALDSTHSRLYDPRLLEDILSKRGFEVIMKESLPTEPVLGNEIHALRSFSQDLGARATPLPAPVSWLKPWSVVKRFVARRVMGLVLPQLDQVRKDLACSLDPVIRALSRVDRGTEIWVQGIRT